MDFGSKIWICKIGYILVLQRYILKFPSLESSKLDQDILHEDSSPCQERVRRIPDFSTYTKTICEWSITNNRLDKHCFSCTAKLYKIHVLKEVGCILIVHITFPGRCNLWGPAAEDISTIEGQGVYICILSIQTFIFTYNWTWQWVSNMGFALFRIGGRTSLWDGLLSKLAGLPGIF